MQTGNEACNGKTYDCRAEVFRDRGREVLGSVVPATQMVTPDPFDVPEIHAEARAAFLSTLDGVKASSQSRIFLIRGQAGCGKTHLIRALRQQIHQQKRGVLAYVHMTSEQTDYRRYLLRQVVRSLSSPYLYDATQPQQASALDLLSDGLVAAAGLPAEAIDPLRDADDASLGGLVSEYAEVLEELKDAEGRSPFDGVDRNILRILFYRQCQRKAIQSRVASFLNGDPLADFDWQKLSALPRECDRGAVHMIGQIARLSGTLLNAPLIVCVDQIEASDLIGNNHDPFVRAAGTAVELFEQVPGMMLLLSCLDSAYDRHAPALPESHRHRIEREEPKPVLLTAARTEREVRLLLSTRLKWLYESEDLEHVPPDSVFPLPEEVPHLLRAHDVRVVLQQVHGYWLRCQHASPDKLPGWGNGPVSPLPVIEPKADVDRLRNRWNDYVTANLPVVSEADDVQFELLTWAVNECQRELPTGSTVATVAKGSEVPSMVVTVRVPRTKTVERLVGLCDKAAQGGGLLRQVNKLEALRGELPQQLVILRSTKFPKTGNAITRIQLLVKGGDLAAEVPDAAWNSMQALRIFLTEKISDFADDVVDEWRRTDRPLCGMEGLKEIMQPGEPAAIGPDAPPPPAIVRVGGAGREAIPIERVNHQIAPAVPNAHSAAATPSTGPSAEATHATPTPEAATLTAAANTERLASPAVSLNEPLILGKSDGFQAATVTLDPHVLTRHTAVLGANGSGKTVLALTILERLLERGVSVVLFDRKGDLASYARPEAWEQTTGAPDEAVRRSALRSAIDVHLFTPGSTSGRPLVLPLLPSGLNRLSPDDRAEEARQAALILTGVCAPSPAKSDAFVAVFAKAVELFCGDDDARTLDDLENLLLNAPQELLAMLPAHTNKHCVEVGRRLNERRIAHGRLFSQEGEPLDLPALLGKGGGKPRMNIVSTQFLEGDASLIWIAQFLAAAGRFLLRNPSPQLQAVLMFDEADQYVPANKKPPTKPGMENLLRRARAAGVGVMLASQNVGDFDYKALDNITTLFAGKLTTQRALEKLRPRLDAAAERLPKKTAGKFVMAVEGDVKEIAASMSLIRPVPVPRDEIERLAARGRA